MEEILSFGTNYTEMGYVLTVVYAVVLYLVAVFSLKGLKKLCNAAASSKGKSAETITHFTYNILKVVVYAVLVYLILIQIKAFASISNILLGTTSVLGVGIALASQESVSNIVGGFFLAFYQPFRVDDLITILDKNITGRVVEIGLRHTVLLTLSNTEIIVPNSIMNGSVIENKDTKHPYQNFLVFSISYDSNIDDAIKIIERNVSNHALIVDNRSVTNSDSKCLCQVVNLGDYAVDIRVAFFTENAGNGFAMSCDLRKSVKEEFDAQGITIPFPTQTIKKA